MLLWPIDSIHQQQLKDQEWEEAKQNVLQVSVNIQPHPALLDHTLQQNYESCPSNEEEIQQKNVQNSTKNNKMNQHT